MANRDFLQAAMPDASLLGITITFLQDKDADLDTSRVEQVRRQADDGVDVPVVEELAADLLLRATAKQHAVRQDDRQRRRSH